MSTGHWQNEPTYGYVWYPRVQRRLAALLLRPLDDAPAVGMDVDWLRSLGVADASLRALGLLGRLVVLDSRPHVGTGVGVLGLRARLRELVPARLEQPRRSSVSRAVGVSRLPYNPWNAWTVVPHHGFGRGYVNVNVVNSTRIDVRTRNAFVVRDAAPDYRGYAVPRSSAPIRSAGSASPHASATDAAVPQRSRSAPASPPRLPQPSRRRPRRSAAAGQRPAPSSGTGYPAPARAAAVDVLAPSADRRRIAASRDAACARSSGRARSPAVAGRALDATTGARSRATSRPRRPSDVRHRRRDARRSTGRTPDCSAPAPSSRPDVYRAVPRSDRPAAEALDVYAPRGVRTAARPIAAIARRRRMRRSARLAPCRGPRPTTAAPPAGYAPRGGVRAPESYRSTAWRPSEARRRRRARHRSRAAPVASVGTTVWVVRRRRIPLAQRRRRRRTVAGRAVPRGGRG